MRLKGLPAGKGFRPATDFIKETIFNLLAGKEKEEEVVDFFAGSGSLGLEALSRGARSCVFVEKSRAALKVLRKNIEKTGFENKTVVVKCDVMESLKRLEHMERSFGVAFVDPPYEESLNISRGSRIYEWLSIVGRGNLLKEGALLVLKHPWRSLFAEVIPGFALERRRRYGEGSLTFLRKEK